MGLSVKEAQATVSSKRFAEWRAYRQVEPWHNPQIDHYLSLMCSMFANMHRDTKESPKPYSPDDFMPEWLRGDKPKQDPAIVKEHLRMWAMALKATHEATQKKRTRNKPEGQ